MMSSYLGSNNAVANAVVSDLTVPMAKVSADPPTANLELGSSFELSANGKFLLVGLPKKAGGGNVTLYERRDNDWILAQELELPAGANIFGSLVRFSANGEFIAVSDPGRTCDGIANAGAIDLFAKSGQSWVYEHTLTNSTPVAGTSLGSSGTGFEFGLAISAAADVIVSRSTSKNIVYAWVKQLDGEWAEQSFESTLEGAQFGRSVGLSLDGNTLAIGHVLAAAGGIAGAGAVLMYYRNGIIWSEGPKLFRLSPVANDYLGVAVRVALNGSMVIAQAERSNKLSSLFVFIKEGDEWKQSQEFYPTGLISGDGYFGSMFDVSPNGRFLIAGARGHTGTSVRAGVGYLYKRIGEQFQLVCRAYEPTGLADDQLGGCASICADGSLIALGASTATIGTAAKAGAILIYKNPVSEVSGASTRTVPGVYAIESNQPLLAIPAGVTAIPLFIGVFRDKFGELLSNGSCIEIANFSDFRRRFGPSQSTTVTLTNGVPSVEDTADLGSLALQLYFDNGGGRCYILPLHDQTNPTELAAMVSKIRRCPEITLYVVTERLDTQTDKYHPACDALDPLLRNVGDGFLIADSYDGEHRPTTTDQRTAVYYPALETAYPARAADEDIDVVGFESENDERVTLAQVKAQDQDLYETISEALDTHYVAEKGVVRLLASAAVAGVYCRTDATLGIWHAPAGPSLNNVRALYPRPKLAVVDKLIDNRINRLYDAPGEGVRVWGARTQEAPELPLWLHINVSRLFDAAARDIKRALQVAVFMPNNAITWNTVRNAINAYLYQLWRDGGLRGATSDEAYYVQIGNETMSAEDLLEGRLIVHVGLAALRPVEFIEVVFSQVLQAG